MSVGSQGWFLRHHDGIEHGPFEIANLVEAARQGNIADDTEVRHDKHTKGKWILATRVSVISAAMPLQLQPISPPVAVPSRVATPGPDLPNESPVVFAAANKHGVSGQGMRVPKDVASAAMALFDFRFRYFITPWIVKLQWIICVVTGCLLLAVGTFAMVVSPVLESTSSQLDQDMSGRGNPPIQWQQSPPSSISWLARTWNSSTARVMRYIVFVATLISGLLIIRLCLEFAIVFFRIANDIGELKSVMEKSTAEMRS